MEIPLNQNPEMPKEVPEAGSASYQLGAASAALAFLLVLVGVIEYSLPSTESGTQVAAAAQTIEKKYDTSAFDTLQLGAKSVYVFDAVHNTAIYARNEETQLPLASITKVALALAVSEVLKPEDTIVIPRSVGASSGSTPLLAGQTWSAKDVLDFTLVASSNGGAQILADVADEALREKYPSAPIGEGALYRMNTLAQELGLTHTYFLNVHGLDESTTQAGAYGSAQDIAKLLAYAAVNNRALFEATAEGGVLLTDANGASAARAYNTNEALGEIPGLVMGKTGFTDLAGGNLGVVFEIEPLRPIVIVVLGSTREGRFADMKALVDATLKTLSEAR